MEYIYMFPGNLQNENKTPLHRRWIEFYFHCKVFCFVFKTEQGSLGKHVSGACACDHVSLSRRPLSAHVTEIFVPTLPSLHMLHVQLFIQVDAPMWAVPYHPSLHSA